MNAYGAARVSIDEVEARRDARRTGVGGAMTDDEVLAAYERHMRTSQFSKSTIEDRLDLLGRLRKSLSSDLMAVTPAELEAFQESFVHLSRASVDIYTRHVLALYKWLVETDRLALNPTRRMVRIKPRKGVPHPIPQAELQRVLACAGESLRMAYVLAAFAGLRCGEITRLRAEDLRLGGAQPTALIQGKGDRERIVPLLPPVVTELTRPGIPTRGVLVLRRDGAPFTSDQLSVESCRFLASIGVRSTLHSCRHYFATEVAELTKDVLLVRDLLGHSSVATTQIYMASSIDGASDRLAGLSTSAGVMLDRS